MWLIKVILKKQKWGTKLARQLYICVTDDHGYFAFSYLQFRHFPLSYLVYINGFVTRITRGASLLEMSLLTLWEHMGSPHFKRGSCQLLVLVRYLSTIVCLHHFLLWRDAGISSSDKFLFICQSVIGKYRTITH